MAVFSFTLIIRDSGHCDFDEVANTVFEAGCDDGLVGRSDGVWFVDFDREAETMADALGSAIVALQQANILVHSVEPSDLVTLAEMSRRFKRGKESVRLLVAGQRGPGHFPAPISGGKSGRRMWSWTESLDWMRRYASESRSVDHDAIKEMHKMLEQAKTLAAFNGALQLVSLSDGVGVREALTATFDDLMLAT